MSAIAAEPVACGSALLEAVTVRFAEDGKIFGAVYKPVGEIVPTLELPPAMPPTSHVTLVLAEPVTIA